MQQETLRGDPVALNTDPLLLNCTLTPSTALHERNLTSRDLFMRFGNSDVSEDFLSRPNGMTLLLNMTATMSMTRQHVYCYARNYVDGDGNLVTLAHQVVVVHREFTPLPPPTLPLLINVINMKP